MDHKKSEEQDQAQAPHLMDLPPALESDPPAPDLPSPAKSVSWSPQLTTDAPPPPTTTPRDSNPYVSTSSSSSSPKMDGGSKSENQIVFFLIDYCYQSKDSLLYIFFAATNHAFVLYNDVFRYYGYCTQCAW